MDTDLHRQDLSTLDAAIADSRDGPLLVDLDGTLLLRNSTELFLDSARPSGLAAILFKVVDVLKPWRVLPGGAMGAFVWRDVLRLWIVALVMPWTWGFWRRAGAAEARAHLNRDLLDRLGGRLFYVVTFGFAPIVKPLLTGIVPPERIIAAPFPRGAAYRKAGKLKAVTDVLGADAVASATVITDHDGHDADLLRVCWAKVVMEWPNHREIRAHADSYVPFDYTSKVKHKTHPHVKRVFLGEDAFMLALATAGAAVNPLLMIPVVVLLSVSFSIVYEIGYADNDRMGPRVEERPTRHEGQDRWPFGTIAATNALAGFVLALPAFACLAFLPGAQSGVSGLAVDWALYLAISVGVFLVFNRLPPEWRVGPFALLQWLKGFGIAWLLALPMTLAGGILLASELINRMIPYTVYRLRGTRPSLPGQTLRLILFCALMVAFTGFGTQTQAWLEPTALIAFGWCIWKARFELLTTLQKPFRAKRKQGPAQS